MTGRPLRRRLMLAGALASPAIVRAAEPFRIGGPAGLCSLLRRHWTDLFPGLGRPRFDGTSDGVTLVKLSSPDAGGLSLILVDAARLIPGTYAPLLATLDQALPCVAPDRRRVDYAHPWLGTVWNHKACDDAEPGCGLDPSLAAWRGRSRATLVFPPFTAVTTPYMLWQAFRSNPGQENTASPVGAADVEAAQAVIDRLRGGGTQFDVMPEAALRSVLQSQPVIAVGVSSALVLPLLEAGEPLDFTPKADGPHRMATPLSAAIPRNAPQPDLARAVVAALVEGSTRAKLAVALHRNGRRAAIEDPAAHADLLWVSAWNRAACAAANPGGATPP